MATSYNLQEQEQLSQLKSFWSGYGRFIIWVLIVVLGAFAAWNGWQYWQRQTALQAAVLYDELDRAARTNDVERVRRVWSDIQAEAGATAQAQQAGLLAAQSLYQSGAADEAKLALRTVVEKSRDPGVAAVARLRLAALELGSGQPEAALPWLNAEFPDAFKGLIEDRRGDILLAQGQTDAARQAYQAAWTALGADLDYRRMVQAKLNALGVDPAPMMVPEESKP